MPNAVQFQNANIAAADKELISFICENTGKIRPLAISDLDSYLHLGTEMLNIGKPFYLEGIGTITKNKSGKFDFSPGEYTLIKENTDAHDMGKKASHSKDRNPVNLPSAVSGQKHGKDCWYLPAHWPLWVWVAGSCTKKIVRLQLNKPLPRKTPVTDNHQLQQIPRRL